MNNYSLNKYFFLTVRKLIFSGIVLICFFMPLHSQNGNAPETNNNNGIEAYFVKERVEIDPSRTFFNVLYVVNTEQKKKR